MRPRRPRELRLGSDSRFAKTGRFKRCMSETTREVSALVREVEHGIQAASAQVKADLERARSVVRDASARLDRSFRALHAATGRQREVLQSVADALYGDEHSGKTFSGSSEALLRQFVDEVIRVSRDSMRIIEQLGDLGARVDGIVGCADSIDVLARETRFIAFNARIETHRAGEAGRTFKVVADEVKRLANASSALSNQIRQSVSDCHAQLREVDKTATGLASHDMSRAIDMHRGLSSAVGKLDEVNRHLEQMLSELESAVAEAVRALQFEDTLAQILNATAQRVHRMGELSIEALRVLEHGRNGDRARPLEEVAHAMRALSLRSAAHSEPSAEGLAELF